MSKTAYSHTIWYEKYRPKSIEELVLNVDVRGVFNSFVENKDFPHLLIYGPPGSGKTTIANILINACNCTSITLNASSGDRGIETMKTTVPTFAKSAPGAGKGLKVVFLDEADNLTADAQKALRNTIETYSKTCRFILTANHVEKIHDALRSRLTAFEFNSFAQRSMVRNIGKILKTENVEYKVEDINLVVERYYPDYRTIINNIQIGSIGGTFVPRNASSLNVDLNYLCECIKSGKLRSAREHLAGVTDFAWLYIHLFAIFLPTLPEKTHKDVMAAIAIADATRDGAANPEIQFAYCMSSIAEALGVEPSMKK